MQPKLVVNAIDKYSISVVKDSEGTEGMAEILLDQEEASPYM